MFSACMLVLCPNVIIFYATILACFFCLLYAQSTHLQKYCNISILLVCLLFNKIVINQILFCNPVNMLLTGLAMTEGMLSSGFSTFMAKFIQNQFGQTASTAAMLGGKMSVLFQILSTCILYMIYIVYIWYKSMSE